MTINQFFKLMEDNIVALSNFTDPDTGDKVISFKLEFSNGEKLKATLVLEPDYD